MHLRIGNKLPIEIQQITLESEICIFQCFGSVVGCWFACSGVCVCVVKLSPGREMLSEAAPLLFPHAPLHSPR